ncbi:binding-protein-dependent transport systems inner membrane component [Calothrix parasitica NIES-267]|uniref:Binding-protein-dependent transport systems inner membrane component n=1 Tax=Calothrix parasitica NIES-267 TaxID=1973488 RepID=A0A1Z4LH74_9CYAN|nr:binding-protein-dependent transport systems inner membrane component [Calothrix parasitica NIES-267]
MEQSIFFNLLSSLQLLLVGYISAVVLGILIGYLVGINRIVYQLGKWILQVPNTIVPVALLPISLIIFKEAEAAAIIIVFFSAIWSIILNTAVGIRHGRKQGRNFRVAIKHIFEGLRFAVWIAWFSAISIEMLTLNQGLGFIIWDAYKESKVDNIIEGIICIAAIGLLLDQLLDLTGNILAELVSDGQKKEG